MDILQAVDEVNWAAEIPAAVETMRDDLERLALDAQVYPADNSAYELLELLDEG